MESFLIATVPKRICTFLLCAYDAISSGYKNHCSFLICHFEENAWNQSIYCCKYSQVRLFEAKNVKLCIINKQIKYRRSRIYKLLSKGGSVISKMRSERRRDRYLARRLRSSENHCEAKISLVMKLRGL